eukprot:CAMPEP_0181062258 /NCGR_PEP_ID=MMETSP1070-20121207/22977_1 /TAXON_ID=265543 /ORGANISM="Minutocellus polymorphus, Strain NH13" /LENGTH=75 /DNA_ID=CAMNT_0023142305 /DNA_START=59 /DNA_END=282 /DNA_ORIENTATION=-
MASSGNRPASTLGRQQMAPPAGGAGPAPSSSASASASNPVVSALPHKSSHPYSSVTLSPDRTHAVVAARDVLRIV